MKILIKMILAFLLGGVAVLILALIYGDKELINNLDWAKKETPKLTLENFDLRLPEVEDPHVMLQLAYKMIETNKPFHAMALIEKALDKALALNDLDLQAEAHYTNGAILHTEPFSNYRMIMDTVGVDYLKLSGFKTALQLYTENDNFAGIALANFALGWYNYGKGRPYMCGYFERARQAMKKVEDQAWLNTTYVGDQYASFEEQLLAAENRPRNTKCEEYTSQPDFWKKFEARYGFGYTPLNNQKRPFTFPPLECEQACQKVWQHWMDQVKAKVEVPDYER